jgi:excinuclease ABC subunit A
MGRPSCIRVVGARQHNLRNISVDIPRGVLTVITGVSGSGKSSLAFDTIHAEGQRRYVESLSVHARQLVEQMPKPDVDRIEGLSPTIAIDQRIGTPGPRSTVGTTTEIVDFLRVLFARTGQARCWVCGRPIVRQSTAQMVDSVLAGDVGRRIMVLAPIVDGQRGSHKAVIDRMIREGFVRARVNGEVVMLEEMAPLAGNRKHSIEIVVDRLVVKPEIVQRLTDSIETATRLANGRVIVAGETQQGAWSDEAFSSTLACPVHVEVRLDEPTPQLFSFNTVQGACETCHGLGVTLEFDPGLVVPDPDRSLNEGAVAAWKHQGRKLSSVYGDMLREFCARFGVAPDMPVKNLSADVRRILMNGTMDVDVTRFGASFEGVMPNLRRRWETTDSESVKQRLQSFLDESPCSQCRGARLNQRALSVKIEGMSIADMAGMTIGRARTIFDELSFSDEAAVIAGPLLREIRERLRFLCDVGVDYLTLDRPTGTLSGGEFQRIRLATQIGGALSGVCYVLDEPTIGLHPRDTRRLTGLLQRLADLDNTVIAVEHDEEVIAGASYVIDIGPGAGPRGGEVVAAGTLEEVLANERSLTACYLSGNHAADAEPWSAPLEKRRPTVEGQGHSGVARCDMLNEFQASSCADSARPEGRGSVDRRAIQWDRVVELHGVTAHNLKRITVRIPLGCFVCITGVSGSGKSTLVSDVLLRALKRGIERGGPKPGAYERISGASLVDKVVEIDTSPIGRTPRSNPATYVGVFNLIRDLFARTREAKIRGYGPARFSFNVAGGRCAQCEGQGTRRVAMHFLPDVFVTCAACGGKRYNRETLDVRYRGKSIADVLDMAVEQAVGFFENFSNIHSRLKALLDVGLGYMTLGQASNTLSGGEAQRVKLAAELHKSGDGHTMYILDEPTTGLHPADVQKLLWLLNRLVDRGQSVVVIEHDLDVMAVADWIIDLGPEGGDAGGRVVVEGRPEDVAVCAESHTGGFLRDRLSGLGRLVRSSGDSTSPVGGN